MEVPGCPSIHAGNKPFGEPGGQQSQGNPTSPRLPSDNRAEAGDRHAVPPLSSSFPDPLSPSMLPPRGHGLLRCPSKPALVMLEASALVKAGAATGVDGDLLQIELAGLGQHCVHRCRTDALIP